MTSHALGRPGDQRRRHRTRGSVVVAVAGLTAVLAAACTPTGPPVTTTTTTYTAVPTPPVALAFDTVGPISASPALVTFSWTVGDANGEPLVCHIDGDGDGTDDVTVTNCENGTPTRNVAVELPPSAVGPTTVTARLTVEDGNSAPVTRTTSFSIAPGPTESFDIVLRGTDSLDPATAAAFTSAAQRWEQVITRGLPDFAGSLAGCQPAEYPIVGNVDDLVIDVAITPIDGPGEILGQAGPSCLNPWTELAVSGVMEFDTADVVAMIGDGNFDDVVLHEMGHVLGFGTLWDLTLYGGTRKVLQGAGGASPRFSGTRAMAEWSALGGLANVPVEAGGGPGTAESHWRESNFGNELMTGWISTVANPLSALTLASLADLGYHVDLDAADVYSTPWPVWGAARRAAPAPVDGVMLRPPFAFA